MALKALHILLIVASILLALAVGARPAAGCAVCYGAGDAAMTAGMNNAILTLLGIVGAVQVGFVALFWNIWRRIRRHREHKDRFHLIHGGAG